jgi:3-hydroxyacyl-[acyl-carrier-protein] dehydratase
MFKYPLLGPDIKRIIPHRYPFLMIDKVDRVDVGESCVAHKNVTNNEWFFEGHFPKHPVMPGVLIIESMAQTACVLVFVTLAEEGSCSPEESEFVYFTSIERARFKRPIVPGDVVRIVVSVKQRRGSKFWRFEGKTFVEDEVADEAEFTAMLPLDK